MKRVAAVAPVVEAHLEGDFDRRRTVVGEKTLGQTRWRERHQAFGQLHRGRVGKAGEYHVLEAVQLRGHRGVDARIRVTEQVHPPGTDGVEIALAVEVLEPGALAALDGHERQRFVIFHLGARVPQHAQIALGESG
jgi:hypothetical protein